MKIFNKKIAIGFLFCAFLVNQVTSPGKVNECYYCRHNECVANNVSVVSCEKIKSEKIVCIHLEMTKKHKDLLGLIFPGKEAELEKHGTFRALDCIGYEPKLAVTCDELDHIDGRSCVLCTKDLCNWRKSNTTKNFFSLSILLFSWFLLFLTGTVK